jgi:hypothetical protein
VEVEQEPKSESHLAHPSNPTFLDDVSVVELIVSFSNDQAQQASTRHRQ